MTLTTFLIIGNVLLFGIAAILCIASGQLRGLHMELRAFREQITAITGGEYDGRVAVALDRLNRLLSLAEAGQLPALRKDDWKPTLSDRDRTKGLRERRADADDHLDPYEGGELWR